MAKTKKALLTSSRAIKKTKDIDELIFRLDTLGIDDDDDASDAEPARPTQPFRFFDLPSELRVRIYENILLQPKTLDLDPSNTRTLLPALRLFYVNRRMHDEASHVFYSRNTFRVFATHGRFFHTKKPLLGRLPAHYVAHLTSLELRLGPGWTKPPKGWVVDARLGLAAAANVRLLKVFIECDPAGHPSFEGFRNEECGAAEQFYTTFSVGLLRGLFGVLGSLQRVEFDAYPGVSRSSPLVRALVEETRAGGKAIGWGPERGWEKIVDVDLGGMLMKLGIGGL
ncbi:hypothetical protein N0V90_005101 [Kalmusia sp. IMI 367209]|nr:hypothetical protein N0V90_005101 [Kalmusia sp. IMI 367209]